MSTAVAQRIRVVVAKPGLDRHDREAKIIARALRDAGIEVIYTGLHQAPEQIVETVIQEDADAVVLSILSGAHMTLVPRVIELLCGQGIEDVVVTVGGTIPSDDVEALERAGVARVLTENYDNEVTIYGFGLPFKMSPHRAAAGPRVADSQPERRRTQFAVGPGLHAAATLRPRRSA